MMHSKLKLLLLFAAISLYCHAELTPFSNDKGKWGFVDDNGKEAVSCKFNEIQNFDRGLYKVRKDHKWGVMNDMGKEVYPVKYDAIDIFAPGVYRLATDGKHKDGVTFDEKYGFGDSAGKILLKPEYEEIGQFHNGVAYVKKGDKYGFINTKIEFVVPCKFAAVGSYNDEGFVWVNEGGKFKKEAPGKIAGGKFGIYDLQGKVIMPVKYKNMGWCAPGNFMPGKEALDKMDWALKNATLESGSHHFMAFFALDPTRFSKISDDAAGFWMSNNGFPSILVQSVEPRTVDTSKNGLVSLSGEVLVQPGKYQKVWFPTDGMAMVKTKTGFCTMNFLDLSTGKLLLKENFHDGWAFNNRYAIVIRPDSPVKKGPKAVKRYLHTIIDKRGKTVSDEYNQIFACKNGVHVVRGDEGYGLIDYKGNEILQADNNILLPPSEGLLLRRIGKDNKFGYVDVTGEWVIKPKYVSAFSFKYGWATVKGKNGWGCIAPDGSTKVPLKWEDIKLLTKENPKVVFVKTSEEDDSFHPYNVKKKSLIGENTYAYCRNFDMDFENVALVGKDEKHIGVINTKGEVLLPLEFNYSVAMQAYSIYQSRENKAWTETDTHRIKLRNNEDRNKTRLHETVDDELWDF